MNTGLINYQLHESPEKSSEVIIFLHGLTGNLHRWDKYLPSFKDKYVLTLDLLGHGNSAYPDELEKFTPKYQASLILELLERLEIKKCIVISHSYSARIAMEMIRMKPFLVEKVVFISPWIDNHKINNGILKIIPVIWKLLGHSKIGKEFEYPQKSTKPSFNDHYKAMMNMGVKSYLGHIYHSDKTAFLSDSRIPCLVITTEQDKICPKPAIDQLKRNFTDLEVITLTSNGHLFLLEKREQITQILNIFLRNAMIGN